MGNSTPNTRRHVISGIVALIVILIILLCLRICKHDKEEVPTPQPTPSASTPQDTIETLTPEAFILIDAFLRALTAVKEPA